MFLRPNPYLLRGVNGVKISVRRLLLVYNNNAAVGIGSMIIFIAMIMVAGVSASVMIQTMTGLEEQALKTADEVIKDISSGVRVSHVSGFCNGSKIDQLAIYVSVTTGSNPVDLSNAYVSLSDSSTQTILAYDITCFSSSVSSGLFGTINSTNISNSEFGIMVVRDIDSSISSTTPTINKDDLVVLLVNTSNCFSGIDTRTAVSGRIIPEYGMRGMIAFNTPSAFTDTIIELQS